MLNRQDAQVYIDMSNLSLELADSSSEKFERPGASSTVVDWVQ